MMLNNYEKDYVALLDKVLTEGTNRTSRAGPTKSLFGVMLTIDALEHGYFPVLTQRKLFLGGILGELAAFLRGATDLQTFKDFKCNYWDANAAAWPPNKGVEPSKQYVGRIYGNMWRKWPAKRVAYQPKPNLQENLPKTFLGIANGHSSYIGLHPLKKTWEDMLTRCYNPKAADYPYYGGRGVYVENRWLAFEAFAADAVNLPGFSPAVLTESSHTWQLDKDTLGNGFCYSQQTCAWLSAEDNNPWQEAWQYTVRAPNGAIETFTNPHKFCLDKGIESKNFCDLWTGRKNAKTRYGYSLISKQAVPKQYRVVDQLQVLIDGLKTEPNSRRHLLTTYNPAQLDEGCLPPCHLLAQYNVRDGKLDCIVYMRSVDLCLGLPSDVVLYATLLLILCGQVGLAPGKLTFMLGDTHIYHNHMAKYTEYKSCQRKTLPTFKLAPCTIDTFTPDAFHLINYQHSGVLAYEFNV